MAEIRHILAAGCQGCNFAGSKEFNCSGVFACGDAIYVIDRIGKKIINRRLMNVQDALKLDEKILDNVATFVDTRERAKQIRNSEHHFIATGSIGR